MSEKLYYEAIARFEAALKVDILPEGHRSRGLHGHSFIARARALPSRNPGPYPATELAELSAQMQRCSELLNYSYLNDSIANPTDENLARWFKRELGRDEIVSIGIQSTTDSGADLADNDVAHIWRRFSFEAAHQLPNVPAGHKCGRMHGHGFEVVIHAEQTLSEDEAMGLDFDLIELKWQALHNQLNYKCLNEIAGLENPTSEHIAAWIWDRLKPELAELSWISIYETRSSGCHYDGRRFRIWKEKSFESALLMRSAPGNSPLHNLHGHSYLVRLHLNGELDEVMGWLVDYGEVKEKFRPTWEKIDHHRLDQIDGLDDISPASFLGWMKTELGESLPELDRIDLYETPGCGAVLCWGSEAPALPTKAL